MKGKIFKILSLLLIVIGSCLGTFLVLDGMGLITIGEVSKITIALKDETKIYDSKPLVPTYEIVDGEFNKEKYELVPEYTTSITDVGSVKCNATFKVLDSDARDVTKLFKITTEPCTLTITKRAISVDCLDTEFEYSGSSLSPSKFLITSNTQLVEGHKLNPVISNLSNNVKAGRATCNVLIQVIDRNGFEVTSNYELTYDNNQEFIINRRSIDITPTSLTKVYDGDPLKLTSYQITSGSLAAGDSVIVSFDKTITDSGDYSIGVKAEFKDSKGNDVNSCYAFSSKSFKATIKPYEITIQLPILTKTYDGKSFEEAVLSAVDEINAKNDKVDVELSSDGIEYVRSIKDVKFDGGVLGNYVLSEDYFIVTEIDNYKVTCLSGHLIINPTKAIVSMPNLSKKYDGKVFSSNIIMNGISVSGIVDKASNNTLYTWSELFTIVEESLPTATKPTLSEKTYTIELTENDDKHNYQFEYQTASLMIEQLYITLDVVQEAAYPNVENISDTILTKYAMNHNNYTLSGDIDGISDDDVTFEYSLKDQVQKTYNLTAKSISFKENGTTPINIDFTSASGIKTRPTNYDLSKESVRNEWKDYCTYLEANKSSSMTKTNPVSDWTNFNVLTQSFALLQYINELENNQTKVDIYIFTVNNGSFNLVNTSNSIVISNFTEVFGDLSKSYDGTRYFILDNTDLEIDQTLSTVLSFPLNTKIRVTVPSAIATARVSYTPILTIVTNNGTPTGTYEVSIGESVLNKCYYKIDKKEITIGLKSTSTRTKEYDGTAFEITQSDININALNGQNVMAKFTFPTGEYIKKITLNKSFITITSGAEEFEIMDLEIMNAEGVNVRDCYDISFDPLKYKGKVSITATTLYVVLNDFELDQNKFKTGNGDNDIDADILKEYMYSKILTFESTGGIDARIDYAESIENGFVIKAEEVEVSSYRQYDEFGVETEVTYYYKKLTANDLENLIIKGSSGNELDSTSYTIKVIYTGSITVIKAIE